MELGLLEKRVVVTGGSRGIGLATASTFVAEGARVVMVARDVAQLESARAMLAQTGEVHAVNGDVATHAGAIDALAKATRLLGGVDVLVNNVGGSGGAGRFDEVDAARFANVVDQNLMSAVWCSQAVLPGMQAARRGVIVNVASVYGREYGPSAPYVAAKGGLIALTKEMGVDLARHGIRVCAVAPGSILFPGGSWDKRRVADPERFAKVLREELPFGRFGAPEEVARVIAFLASDAASWLTGITVPVDGGQGRAL